MSLKCFVSPYLFEIPYSVALSFLKTFLVCLFDFALAVRLQIKSISGSSWVLLFLSRLPMLIIVTFNCPYFYDLWIFFFFPVCDGTFFLQFSVYTDLFNIF